jgi:hypothetical protein
MSKKDLLKALLLVVIGLTFALPGHTTIVQGKHKVKKERGHPGEYDPGPSKTSKWLELFGSVPNYRALGKYILDSRGEKFRWKFGPMWYRGRLGENEVKIFVVGQEGAQDENVSNRAFTGSTGTKTQKFLNHIGIHRSYLFMNTFVYTINGQLDHDDPRFKWMEQGEDSPLVEYRHALFDNMLETNTETLAIILGVGSGGKASVASWINARGGDCSASRNLAECDTKGFTNYFNKKLARSGKKLRNKEILVIGVPHPGGASPRNGGLGALQNIIRGFTSAATRVRNYRKENPGSFEPDSGMSDTIPEKYRYSNAPIPFFDFSFGTNWRMGSQGTTSNRRGSQTIQVFSRDGKYNNEGHNVSYGKSPEDKDSGLKKSGDKFVAIRGMGPDDVPYEPPRWYSSDKSHAAQFDYGPCPGAVQSCDESIALQNWPDFWSLDTAIKPKSHPSFGHGPSYRGRFNNAKVFILADQYAHDDFFSTRALTGEMGQKLQTLLNVANVGSDYLIVRTLPVDTLGMNKTDVLKLALNTAVTDVHKEIFGLVEDSVKVVWTLGSVAKEVAKEYGFAKSKTFNLSSSGSDADWDKVAAKTAEILDTSKSGSYKGQLTTIPRNDLPIHSRWWMGSSGTRAKRGEAGENTGDYYKVYAPYWVTKLRPRTLKSSETKSIDSILADLDNRGRAGDVFDQWLGLDPADLLERRACTALEVEGQLIEDAHWEYWGPELDSLTVAEIDDVIEIQGRDGDPSGFLSGEFIFGTAYVEESDIEE